MNIRRRLILTAGASLLLAAFSGMALASPSPQKPKSKPTTHVSRGTISSIDNDRLVLSQKGKKGKAEQLTFMLNSKTERKGELTPGAQVNVHYLSENNQLTATAVQATQQKKASSTKKPGGKM